MSAIESRRTGLYKSYISEDGETCVLEVNWASGERCQMIWKSQRGGDVVVTTCRKDTPPIRIAVDQRSVLAGFLTGDV
jgi:hypothetical protein